MELNSKSIKRAVLKLKLTIEVLIREPLQFQTVYDKSLLTDRRR